MLLVCIACAAVEGAVFCDWPAVALSVSCAVTSCAAYTILKEMERRK